MKRQAEQFEGDRMQALSAALPPLIVGTGIVLRALVVGDAWYEVANWRLFLGVTLNLVWVGVLFVVGLIALAKGVPAWGATWLGGGLAALAILINVAAEERAEVGLPLISPVGDAIVAGVLFLVILIALTRVALRGWRKAGLVSVGMSMVLGLTLFSSVVNPPFNRVDLGLLALPAALLFAGLVVVYVTKGDVARWAALLAVEGVNVGFVLLGNQVWRDFVAGQGGTSSPWPFLVVLTGTLVAGPALAFVLRWFRVLLDQRDALGP